MRNVSIFTDIPENTPDQTLPSGYRLMGNVEQEGKGHVCFVKPEDIHVVHGELISLFGGWSQVIEVMA